MKIQVEAFCEPGQELTQLWVYEIECTHKRGDQLYRPELELRASVPMGVIDAMEQVLDPYLRAAALGEKQTGNIEYHVMKTDDIEIVLTSTEDGNRFKWEVATRCPLEYDVRVLSSGYAATSIDAFEKACDFAEKAFSGNFADADPFEVSIQYTQV